MKLASIAIAVGTALAGPVSYLEKMQKTPTAHFPQAKDGLQPRSDDRQTNDTSINLSGDWSGAILRGTGFTSITTQFRVPTLLSIGRGTAWVGIDGDIACPTALLQTGISWDKTPHNTTYTAWYEWFPKPQVGFEDMSISAGDLIQATIHATSNTSGIATIENLSTGETAGRLFAGETSSLCGRTAEWIVEDFDVDGSLVGFADYGGVEFTGSWAVGGDGARVDAGDADLVTMVSGVGRDTLSTCAVNGTNVSCKYGPV